MKHAFQSITPAQLLTLKAGSLIRITTKMKSGARVETATLNNTEQCEGFVYFGFGPCEEPDSVQCGFGYKRHHDIPRLFGLQKVEVEVTHV